MFCARTISINKYMCLLEWLFRKYYSSSTLAVETYSDLLSILREHTQHDTPVTMDALWGQPRSQAPRRWPGNEATVGSTQLFIAFTCLLTRSTSGTGRTGFGGSGTSFIWHFLPVVRLSEASGNRLQKEHR